MNPVQGADAARRGVRKELAVEQHHPTDEVKSEEHGHGQDHVDGHLGVKPLAGLRQGAGPGERHVPRDRVDGAYEKLH